MARLRQRPRRDRRRNVPRPPSLSLRRSAAPRRYAAEGAETVSRGAVGSSCRSPVAVPIAFPFLSPPSGGKTGTGGRGGVDCHVASLLAMTMARGGVDCHVEIATSGVALLAMTMWGTEIAALSMAAQKKNRYPLPSTDSAAHGHKENVKRSRDRLRTIIVSAIQEDVKGNFCDFFVGNGFSDFLA